jgi:hypothetical protein
MDTFILAVRLATDRVRALLLGDALDDAEAVTPETLHAAMVGREPSQAPPPAAPPRPAPGGARRNLVAGAVVVPSAPEIASGHVWPPVRGRAALAAATSSPLVAPAEVQPWAPDGALELAGAGWILHSSERWIFEAEPVARVRLLALVRRLLPHAEALPDGRALVVARDGARWRMWLVTPRVPTLAEAGRAAASPAALTALAARRLRELGLDGRPLPAGASGLGLCDGRLVLLAVDEGDDAPGPERREPLAELEGR